MVFGENASTTGARSDLAQVTAAAARFVRVHGFDKRLSKTDAVQLTDENLNTDIAPTNVAMEAILAEQQARAKALLTENSVLFMRITQELLEHGEVSTARFAQWLGIEDVSGESALEPYAQQLAAFGDRIEIMGSRTR